VSDLLVAERAAGPRHSQVVEVTDLKLRSAAGEELVHGVSFTLEPGKSLGIVGESGSGKTLTAMSLVGLLPQGVVATSGSILVNGREVFERTPAVRRQLLRDTFGVVFQNPTVSLNPRLTIWQQVREALPTTIRRSRGRSYQRAVELLEHVGVNRPTDRLRAFPHELSGGLNQRIVIAIAIARSPQVLVADEATTALDVSVQKQVLDLIDNLRTELNLGLILVSHDIGVIADRADDVLVMHDGEVVESGQATTVLQNPAHEYTQQLLEAIPRMDAEVPASADDQRPILLEGTGLVRQFAVVGKRETHVRALDDVDITLREGQALGVVGESGSGKTTLARVLVGLDRQNQGTFSAFGKEVHGRTIQSRRDDLGDVEYVFQDPYSSLDPRQTVAQIVAEPIELKGTPERKAHKRETVLELLDDVRLPREFADTKPSQLSGGQRQRVVIARALALEPKVLIADEPVSALDLSVQGRILALLARLREEHNLTYLVISHDLAVIRQLCTDVVVMREGKVVERGTTEEIFDNPRDSYTRLLLEAIPGGAWLHEPEKQTGTRE
jgi:peptide/nickel transport system ATP-binding protein